jgi:hypothetical protein
MDPILVQIGIAAATILGSGVVSAMVNHRFTARRAEIEFRRKKMEELFLAFHGYCSQIATLNVVWPKVMNGELSYNEALDLNSNHSERGRDHFENVEMLVSLYFPDLSGPWREVLAVRDRINEVKGDFKQAYKIGGPDPAFVQPFWTVLQSLEPAEKAFKDQLASKSTHT